MTELVFHITAKTAQQYTVRFDDEQFASSFRKDIEQYLGGKNSFDVKDLLNAFIEKCLAAHKDESQLNSVIGNLTKTLDNELKN